MSLVQGQVAACRNLPLTLASEQVMQQMFLAHFDMCLLSMAKWNHILVYTICTLTKAKAHKVGFELFFSVADIVA